MTDVVGYFPYLNIWPFVQGLPAGIERVVASPRALVEFARAGRLDVAILPVVDVPTLADRYEPLGDLGLAVAGPVWSVLLLARRPIEALNGARICATPESSTSVRLLTVLLRDRYGVRDWQWSPTPEAADAWLVIGDTALAIYWDRQSGHTGIRESGHSGVRESGGARTFPFMYDLADEWTRWQGRPFVFARWVARRDRPAAWRRAWYERLLAALEAHLPRLHGSGPVDGLRPRQIAYLRRFEYRLSPAALDGWVRFHALWREANVP
ncbi:Chorismate dehydratase [bacterium HR11]|nr:Chorismate dehydratase [bacterium HR11]